jgi:hypothetical protein
MGVSVPKAPEVKHPQTVESACHCKFQDSVVSIHLIFFSRHKLPYFVLKQFVFHQKISLVTNHSVKKRNKQNKKKNKNKKNAS